MSSQQRTFMMEDWSLRRAQNVQSQPNSLINIKIHGSDQAHAQTHAGLRRFDIILATRESAIAQVQNLMDECSERQSPQKWMAFIGVLGEVCSTFIYMVR